MPASRQRTRTLVLALLLLLTAGLGGMAYAFWSSSGSGSGSASVQTDTPALTLTAVVVGSLRPGVTQSVTFSAFNPTSADLVVQSVNSITVTGTDKAGCAVDNFRVTPSVSQGGKLVPSGARVVLDHPASLEFVNNPNVSQDACKGAQVALAFTSN